MGKRKTGFLSPCDSSVLLSRLESCKNVDKSNIDGVVEYLRSNFPEYRRINEQPFAKLVHQTLEYHQKKILSSSPKSIIKEEEEEEEEEEDDGNNTRSRKKTKKADLAEERLLRTESDYIRRKNKQQRSSDSSSEEDKEEPISTSEDLIFEDPIFDDPLIEVDSDSDLMKSMIRSNDSASNSKTEVSNSEVKSVNEGKIIQRSSNLEMEVHDNSKKLELKDNTIRGTKSLNSAQNSLSNTLIHSPVNAQTLQMSMSQNPQSQIQQPHLHSQIQKPPHYQQNPQSQIQQPHLQSQIQKPQHYQQNPQSQIQQPHSQSQIQKPQHYQQNPQSQIQQPHLYSQTQRGYLTGAMPPRSQQLYQTSLQQNSQSQIQQPHQNLHTQRSSVLLPTNPLSCPIAISQNSNLQMGNQIINTPQHQLLQQKLQLLQQQRQQQQQQIGLGAATGMGNMGNMGNNMVRLGGTSNVGMGGMRGMGPSIAVPMGPVSGVGNVKNLSGGSVEALGQGNRVDSKSPSSVELKGGGDGDHVVKGKDGPRFTDLGGMKGVLDELMMEVIFPLFHPQLPRLLGVRPMAGILFHGPPGCGKTKLAHAIANETGVPFYKLSAAEVVSCIVGASEKNIRDIFSKAYRTAPSIVFIDEIDAIASKRENLQRDFDRRIVTQLMTCMDESHQTLGSVDENLDSETTERRSRYILVIGATNRPDAVDAALRRPGRFDREIVLGVPDENARVEILSVLTRNLKLEGTFDLGKIARTTPGFVGADLAALANKAGNLAMKRIIDSRKNKLSRETNEVESNDEWWRHPWEPAEMERLSITMADFEAAAKMVQPSSTREGFSAIPNVKWEDVGGLNFLRKEFDRYIVRRVKHPEVYEEFGVDLESGFLLYGPPGCGKTLIAKAVANEAGANFIHIKGPELLNKYVGESELAVRTIFRRACTCSPCILFFDEVDALTTVRGNAGSWVTERLLNQLLIELDGADHRRGVFVIGATNRFEVMDPAVLRPGRFGKRLYVPLPSAEQRGLILKALARKKPLAGDVNLEAIAQSQACENRSGADLAAVMNEAAMAALEEKQIAESEGSSSSSSTSWVIKTSHFEQGLEKIPPSVSDEQRRYYDRMSLRFKTA
ncbi:cell division control protein 48 homolog C-like [Tasmannia lanceolata]|uniref:cell division control protein 48 homolog C-like n=1 Tax=Tasmannia lanceolata TaxID=3420 RepID=UPI004063E117